MCACARRKTGDSDHRFCFEFADPIVSKTIEYSRIAAHRIIVSFVAENGMFLELLLKVYRRYQFVSGSAVDFRCSRFVQSVVLQHRT